MKIFTAALACSQNAKLHTKRSMWKSQNWKQHSTMIGSHVCISFSFSSWSAETTNRCFPVLIVITSHHSKAEKVEKIERKTICISRYSKIGRKNTTEKLCMPERKVNYVPLEKVFFVNKNINTCARSHHTDLILNEN